MKKYLCRLLIFIVSLYGFYQFFSEKEPVIFRVGSECDYVPNNWEEDKPTDSNVPIANKENAYAEGYDIQIAKLVAKSMGAKLEVVKLPYQYLIEALNKHEIDAIFSGMLDTKARRNLISFSDVYDVHVASYTILVHKDGKYAEAKTLKDFIGASLAAQKGTKFDWAAAQVKGAIHLPSASNIQEIFNKLKKQEIDATIVDSDMAQTYARVFPDFKIIKFQEGQGFKFDFTGVCAGVRRGDTKLIKAINRALDEISGRDRQKIMDQTILRSWGTSIK